MPVTGINAIETGFINEWTTNIQMLAQRGAKLRPTVMVGSHTGEGAVAVAQVPATAAVERTTRHSDTPFVAMGHDRRWVYPTDYEWATLIDSQDKLRMIADPTSTYVQSAIKALGRAEDQLIITAATGAAATGKSGGTSTSITNTIAHGSTGLTVDKLRQALYLLEDDDVDPEMEDLFFVISPKGKQQLLETTEVTSSDYAAVKALVSGQLDTFLGFKFITHTGLTVASNIRTCFAYARSGLHLGIWDDVMATVSIRNDKSYAAQPYVKQTMGAVRLEESKVVKVDIDETA